MSFFYYILDNFLWSVKIGILSEVVSKSTEHQFKRYKNSFSLVKFIMKIAKSFINLALRQKYL